MIWEFGELGKIMGFTVEQVIPWGCSFDEHLQMFALREDDLHYSYLDWAGGPASFNR